MPIERLLLDGPRKESIDVQAQCQARQGSLGKSGHDEEGHILPRPRPREPNLPEKLEPVHPWHPQVGDDRVYPASARRKLVDSVSTIAGFDNLAGTDALQYSNQPLQADGRVINNQIARRVTYSR
jgi:hypothetical protein